MHVVDGLTDKTFRTHPEIYYKIGVTALSSICIMCTIAVYPIKALPNVINNIFGRNVQ